MRKQRSCTGSHPTALVTVECLIALPPWHQPELLGRTRAAGYRQHYAMPISDSSTSAVSQPMATIWDDAGRGRGRIISSTSEKAERGRAETGQSKGCCLGAALRVGQGDNESRCIEVPGLSCTVVAFYMVPTRTCAVKGSNERCL